uniref:Tc1-like transposase DDE domain-containing protein n=1 Tax=Oncorhynchus tshawytscha TaxID=74940 RepID=A0AAZ3NY09_ONCTS
MFHRATGKIFCGQMKLKLSCLEGTQNTMCGEKRHSTPASKPHPNCKVWWRECHSLGQLAIINRKMNSQVYQDIFQENVHQLNLNRSWVMQQDNDPKHRSKSTTEGQQQKKICLLEWLSQSPDLSPIEMLWHDLKRTVHTRHPKNIADLKQFCKEEWSKIPPDHCAGLIRNHRKLWLRLLLPKEGQPVIKSKGSHPFPPCTVNVYMVCSIKT